MKSLFRWMDHPPCRAAVGRGTVRRMVEGPVGLGGTLGDRACSRRAVIAAPAPPSSAFTTASANATSPSLRAREDIIPTPFPTASISWHIPPWLFDNRIECLPSGPKGSVLLRGVSRLRFFHLFRNVVRKLSQEPVLKAKIAQIPFPIASGLFQNITL